MPLAPTIKKVALITIILNNITIFPEIDIINFFHFSFTFLIIFSVLSLFAKIYFPFNQLLKNDPPKRKKNKERLKVR